MPSEATSAKSAARKVVKRLCFILVVVLLAVVIAFLMILGTETGRLWAIDTAVSAVNRSETMQVQLEELHSPALGELEIGSLQIRKNHQLWIDASGFDLDWQPSALVRKKLSVNRLHLSQLYIYSVEASEEAEIEVEATDGPLDLNSLNIPEIQIKEFSADSIRLRSSPDSEADNPEAQIPEIAVEGHLEWLKATPFQLGMNAEITGIFPTTIVLAVSEEQSQLGLNASINEPAGGLVGSLIRLPEGQPLNGDLVARIFRQERNINLHISSLSFPVGDRSLGALGSLVVSPDLSEIALSDFLLRIDETEHGISGRLDNRTLDFALGLNAFPLGLLTDFNLLSYQDSVISDGTLSAAINLAGTLDSPVFDAAGNVDTELNSESLTAAFSGNGGVSAVDIDQLELSWAGALLSANGALDMQTDQSQISVQLTNFDLTRLREFGVEIPEGVEANLEAANGEIRGNMRDPDADFTVNLIGNYDSQPFELTAKAQKNLNRVSVESIRMSFRDSQTLVSGSMDVDTLIGEFNLDTDPFSIKMLEIAGVNLPADLKGNLQGTASVTGELRNPEVQASLTLLGTYKEIPYSAIADLSRIDRAINIRSVKISARERDILDIQGAVDEENVDIRFIANRLPTELLSAAGLDIAPGGFSADFSVKGPLTQPNLSGFLDYKTEAHTLSDNGRLADNQFEWRLEADTIEAEAADSSASQSISTANASYSLRSQFLTEGVSSGELAIKIPAKPYMDLVNRGHNLDIGGLPLNITLDGDFDLRLVSLFADPDIHRITGNLTTDLSIQGTIASPSFIGEVAFQNTDYDNPISGTYIEALNCALHAEDDRFEFGECVASDGNSGSFDIQGSLALPLRGSTGDIDIEMTVNQAHILQRPEVESQATGNIQLTGDFKSLLAKGNIEVAPLEASIEANTSSGIPKIKVERVDSLEYHNREDEADKQASPVISLDLLVTASQQAYIRGRGLEAELRGEIYLRGTAREPLYEGEFSTIRGDLELFGKDFDLESGLVNFANDALGLNFEAIYEEDGQRITAFITGTVEDLSISFSATPSMAEDEILAFIIFGKSVQEITTFEAIQLASAVQQLRGGGGFDPIGAARDTLGVDRLSIESETLEDDSTGVNLGVGKYLNEKVYLELERTPNPSQPWKGSLEIELAPNLNLESSTGGSTGIEGAELKWKKDY